jgi:hypothetical protein
MVYSDTGPGGVFESTNAGASWSLLASRRMFYSVWGTYTLPGLTHNLVRNYVSHVQLVLQSGKQSHSRVDTSVPLVNLPEQLSSYWRTDFDRDPTLTDADGDGTLDWALAAGTFDDGTLLDGVWSAAAGVALETRPANDFTNTTVVEVCCKNKSSSGNGAVTHINADRQGGLYAPLSAVLKLQSDGITQYQTLTLLGYTSDFNPVTLFTSPRLSTDFVTFRLTLLPQLNLVNVHINGEDQGAYTYPAYAPTESNRFLTIFADASQAEFDYADVRVTAN